MMVQIGPETPKNWLFVEQPQLQLVHFGPFLWPEEGNNPTKKMYFKGGAEFLKRRRTERGPANALLASPGYALLVASLIMYRTLGYQIYGRNKDWTRLTSWCQFFSPKVRFLGTFFSDPKRGRINLFIFLWPRFVPKVIFISDLWILVQFFFPCQVYKTVSI